MIWIKGSAQGLAHLSGMPSRTIQKEASGPSAPHRKANPECQACPVRVTSFCSEVPDDEIEDLRRNRQRITMAKRQALVCESAPAQAYYNIVFGVVKLSRSTCDGRKQIVDFRGPGSFFAVPELGQDSLHVEALSDVQLCRFSRRQFKHLVTKHPRLLSRLLADSLDRIDALENHALLLGRKTAREKIATFLLQRQNAAKAGHPDGQRIDVPMTRTEIAEFLGLVPETVSRILAAFKREGMITFGQTQYVWLLDTPSLERAALGS